MRGWPRSGRPRCSACLLAANPSEERPWRRAPGAGPIPAQSLVGPLPEEDSLGEVIGAPFGCVSHY